MQSRRVTQSFGVDEESRHLRTPTNYRPLAGYGLPPPPGGIL